MNNSYCEDIEYICMEESDFDRPNIPNQPLCFGVVIKIFMPSDGQFFLIKNIEKSRKYTYSLLLPSSDSIDFHLVISISSAL